VPAYIVLQGHVRALAHQEAADLGVVVARRDVQWGAQLVVGSIDEDTLLDRLDDQLRVAAAAGKVQLRFLPRLWRRLRRLLAHRRGSRGQAAHSAARAGTARGTHGAAGTEGGGR